MKPFLCFVITLLCVYTANAQAYKFDGDWSGKVSINGQSNTMWVRLKIEGSYITQYFYNENSQSWDPVSPVLARYEFNKNNFIYYWMNNSSVWSETQTYLLSYVNDEKLYVVWSRQVNNIKEDEDNDVWSIQGEGYLTKRD